MSPLSVPPLPALSHGLNRWNFCQPKSWLTCCQLFLLNKMELSDAICVLFWSICSVFCGFRLELSMEKEQNKSMYADLGHFSQSSIQDVANCIRPLRFHHKSQMGGACFSTQLIDGDGVFNVSKLENFMKEVRLGACRLSYAIVSIMGPQSSGKSTLLNHLLAPMLGRRMLSKEGHRLPKVYGWSW
ncbi:uncharacterized protein LOC112900564 [Panicum hallii]|uniref:uncharacterized protein LOC112900564 n=1 Tax=Panicum hallii TaxID=206008 RepID=UPI000DF4EEE4|nr:uncharacterized protein LOC112900564 [Panicum hallii]